MSALLLAVLLLGETPRPDRGQPCSGQPHSRVTGSGCVSGSGSEA